MLDIVKCRGIFLNAINNSAKFYWIETIFKHFYTIWFLFIYVLEYL